MRRAFTIPELLIVLSILAILYSFSIPNVSKSTSKAEILKMQNDIHGIVQVEFQTKAMKNHYESLEATGTESDNGTFWGSLGGKYSISENITATVDLKSCSKGSEGFVVEVRNSNVSDYYSFDSCEDGSPIYNRGES